ncbi:hypothetical protein BC939DRAFT_436861 [Gamsiella multidivaricata]|uniref:uncharacterized protein n=1 Tax=Gamsiella multidivaricata TaxID=101098 RepID=UPI00221EA1BF|nr:uncharacterized protein BC939DRAFT_436861 [Gamsiella multidivaricata]KAG0360402.1 hypothetical protein BGZ54_009573 [Gamsiella multidivaricata]KAI7831367.1 hypothetical protein BC939DRAFT_436861 [Gamsiella multidivaricata]
MHGIHDVHNATANRITGAMQRQVDIRHREFLKYKKLYTGQSRNLRKDLTELHDLNNQQFRDHLAQLRREAQEQLNTTITQRNASLRGIRVQRAQQQRRIQDSFLARRQAQGRCRPHPEYLLEHPLYPDFRIDAVQEEPLRVAVATVGPVCLPNLEAEAVERLRRTAVDNTTPRTPLSDGSMINAGTEEIAMAFGVVDRSQTETLTVHGRTEGYASSAKAELMGLHTAILASPPTQDIIVEPDNQSVVRQYQLVKERRETLPRKRQPSNYAGL